MPLQVTQVDCRSCGAKLDLQTGLRARTFVCEYCGTVNGHEGVVAVQNLQELRERYRPWSHLRLGHRATLLGREYRIIGRIRCEEQSWWWDEWLLYSDTGFPLWLQEGEGGFRIFRVFYPTVPVNVRGAGGSLKLEKDAGTVKIRERGTGAIVFIEGELTWSARPGETFQYLEAARGRKLYSVEFTDQEVQFLRGEIRDTAEVYASFGLTEAPPPPLEFDDDDDDDDDEAWDERAPEVIRYRCPSCGRHLKSSEGLASHQRDKHGEVMSAEDARAFAVSVPRDGGRGGGSRGQRPRSSDAPQGPKARPWGQSSRFASWVWVGVAAAIAVGLLAYSQVVESKARVVKSWTFPARAATSPTEGALLTDAQGKPVAVTLPHTKSFYELRLASSALAKSGRKGGHCFWTEVEFLKAREGCALKTRAYAELVRDELIGPLVTALRQRHPKRTASAVAQGIDVRPGCDGVTLTLKGDLSADLPVTREVAASRQSPPVEVSALDAARGAATFRVAPKALAKLVADIDAWERYQVVHRVSTWFGLYWGVDEGERWTETSYVRHHFFRTKDRGPYYLRVFSGNCDDYASRVGFNTVKRPAVTLAVYTNATNTETIYGPGFAMLVFLFVYVMVNMGRFFGSD